MSTPTLTLTEKLWPKLEPAPPSGRARRAALLLAVGAAVVVPLRRPGLGWMLAAIGLVAVFAVAHQGPEPARRAGDRVTRIAAAVAAVALASVGTLRAATWLFTMCVFMAVFLASYAVVGGRTWRDLLVDSIALPWSALMALNDWTSPPGTRSGWRMSRTIAISAVLLGIFGALFSAADPAFAHLFRIVTPSFTAVRLVEAAFSFALFGLLGVGVAYARSRRAELPAADGPEPLRRFGRRDWVIPLALLDLLFAVFVWVQIDVLFAGNEYILGANGPDYAVYARNGFSQLLVVTVLTLAVVAVTARYAPRAEHRDRLLLRLLVGGLCLLTLVIVASAVQRMRLYVDAYGFTRSRLVADSVEIWLGLVLVLVLVAGVRLRGQWLPRAVVAAGVAVLFGLVAINPDAYIARTVIARYEKDGHLDWAYLYHLSSDAVPELATLPVDQQTDCLIGHVVWADGGADDPWYAYNAGRAIADTYNEKPKACNHS